MAKSWHSAVAFVATGILGALLAVVASYALVELLSTSDSVLGFMAVGGAVFFGIIPPILLTVGIGAYVAIWSVRSIRLETRPTFKRRKKITLAAFAVSPILLFCFSSYRYQHANEPPSDRELLENFVAHQSAFDEMAKMAKTDKALTRVDEDWTNPSEPSAIGVDSTRLQTYRDLFGEAGVPRGLTSFDEGKEIDFMYWGVGSAVSDDYDKGYAYLSSPPKAPQKNLDSFEPNGMVVEKRFRHLHGNWYLYVQYMPG